MEGLRTLKQFEKYNHFGKPGAYLRADRWVRIIKILEREAHIELPGDAKDQMYDDITRLKHELGIKAQ